MEKDPQVLAARLRANDPLTDAERDYAGGLLDGTIRPPPPQLVRRMKTIGRRLLIARFVLIYEALMAPCDREEGVAAAREAFGSGAGRRTVFTAFDELERDQELATATRHFALECAADFADIRQLCDLLGRPEPGRAVKLRLARNQALAWGRRAECSK